MDSDGQDTVCLYRGTDGEFRQAGKCGVLWAVYVSQYGIKADGSAVETVGGYKDFNYNDPMNPANKFRPNLLLDFLTGSFKGRNVEVEGTIIANASFVRMHDFRANEGYFFFESGFWL